MRRAARNKVALLMALLAGFAQAASYYPYIPGAVWRYSNGETQKVGAPRVVRGVQVLPLQHIFAGRVLSEDLLELRTDGVWLRGTSAGKSLNWYATGLQLYPASPLSPGASWTSSSNSITLTGRVMGSDAVHTAAGSYNALLIRTEVATLGGSASAQFADFVPGLGVVRFLGEDGARVDLLR